MPIYAYRCQDCGFEKDHLQKMSDPPLTECPSCGGQGFARVLTAPAFQLKGSGWYVTDFRDQGAKGRKPSEPGAAGAESSREGSSGAEPAGEGVKAAASADGAGSSGAKSDTPVPAPVAPAGGGASTASGPASA